MLELLEFAFSGVNIIPTILLIFTVAYWLIVILGVIDVDTLDFDLDTDVDVDLDAEVDLDGLSAVLAFFNIGQMPLMVFITFYSLPLWMFTLMGNDWFGFQSFGAGLFVFIPMMIGSLFVAKILTMPVAKFYKKIKGQTEAVENIVGKICVAKLKITGEKKSQAEIKVKGTSILIYVKTKDGINIEKGETALVIDFEKEQKYYYVEPYQL